MINNIRVVNRHSQVKELASELKFDMLRELISSAATCQQLARVFGVSKQKIHYNLNKLLDQDLIEVDQDIPSNGKEIFYHATAKNFVLDFALGEQVQDSSINGREVIQSIVESEYRIPLSAIAAKILQDSLKLKARQKLLIVTGKYNLPLVEKILLEAGRMNIRCTLLYQDSGMLKAKYEEYTLSAFNADYKHFNRLLKSHDVFLNLNGEARHILLTDPDKLRLRQDHFSRSAQIITDRKIRVAMMPGLLHNTLSDKAIESELQFWKALDVDYEQLSRDTLETCELFRDTQHLHIQGNDSNLSFKLQNIYSETGSFGTSPCQCPTINYPGGEILMLPAERTMDGEIRGDLAYAFGQKIKKPILVIKDNEIKTFSAEENEALLARAMQQGGSDGRKVALVTMGTNPNVSLANIDLSFKQKSRGLLSLYWGDNRNLGGKVAGTYEWFLQIEKPEIHSR